MKWLKNNRREEADLWYAALTAVAVGALYYTVNSSHAFRAFVARYSDLPYTEAAANGLFFLVLGLLWFAYAQWRFVTFDKEDLESVVQSLNHDVVMVVNPERRIVGCNEAMAHVFGYTPEEVLGQTTDRIYFDRRVKKGYGREIFDQIERFGYHVGFATGRRKDGSQLPLEIFTGKFKGRRGIVLLVCDISERVEAETQLREAKEAAESAREEAEQANEEKSQVLVQLQENYKRLAEAEETRDSLVHMIVHDMKLPLQVIKGYVELIKKKKAQGAAEIADVYIDETLAQTSRLVDMVHSLLDIKRFESNEMPLHIDQCDLGGTAQFAIDSLGCLATDRNVNLERAQDTLHVPCDREIIVRVFSNLLNNAVKYTPAGGDITVRLDAREHEVYVEVLDQGPGIAPEYHDRIFEKFGQAEQAKNKRKHSTGLGLTFCKLALEAHGGQIGVRSSPGQGCTFWFALPMNVPNLKVLPQAAA